MLLLQLVEMLWVGLIVSSSNVLRVVPVTLMTRDRTPLTLGMVKVGLSVRQHRAGMVAAPPHRFIGHGWGVMVRIRKRRMLNSSFDGTSVDFRIGMYGSVVVKMLMGIGKISGMIMSAMDRRRFITQTRTRNLRKSGIKEIRLRRCGERPFPEVVSQHRLSEVRARLQGAIPQRSLLPVRPVLQGRGQGRVTREGEWLAFLNGLQRLGQRPDVVVGESERLDLGQFRLVRKCWQDESEFF